MRTVAEASLTDEERRVIDRWIELMGEEQLDIQSVWLYGSRARGEGWPPESDVDLLVITRGDRRRDDDLAWELINRAANELGANPVPFLPHVWDVEHLDDRRSIRSFFVQEVDRDKIVLYGEP
jgi:predicted nucleotidyltransferase